MSEDRKIGPTLGDVVSAAALVLGLITAWLYVTGWTYAYHYLNAFRIPMLMAELPKEHLFVYGGLVLWKNLFATILIALVLFAAISACVFYRHHLQRFGITTIIVILVLATFIVGRLGAVHTADAEFEGQRSRDFDAYPRVRLELKDTDSGSKDLLGDIAKTNCGRLFLATPSQLFLIRPIRDVDYPLDTFVVPRSEIKSVRIYGKYSSCP